MKYIAVCLFVLVVLCSASVRIDDIIKKVNLGGKWKAHRNPNIDVYQQKVQRNFGWRREQETKKFPAAVVDKLEQIPTTFNSAQNWPKCSTIGTIYNQAECGSCWAFAGTEHAADRFCVATQAAFNQQLSFAMMTECNQEADGCEGGSAGAVLDFLQQNGLVTNNCYPYNIPTCPPQDQPCLNFVPTPNCWTNNTCSDGSSWKPYLYGNVYQYNSVQDIQTGIMTKGPVMACFSVYEDFLTYKTGVYQHTTGAYLGGHCVKIIGWGVENGTPYWLCNNQWTTSWGDKGQFKIVLGQDECGIEDSVVAGDPQV